MIRLLLLLALTASAEDWPEWRGTGRQGVWRETGILQQFPPSGLKATWRRPVKAGYSGPVVANGRVFVMDHERGSGTAVTERVQALDEATGRILWTRQWPADYRGLDYANGPRATPTVDGDRVYTLGAMGALRCFRVQDGSELWTKDFVRDFGTTVPGWGMSAAPIIDGPRLIAVVAGAGNAKVVAFEKHTGKELWRALSSKDSEPGYSQPILLPGPPRQLIVWHATAIDALDPATGRSHWSHPFRIQMNTPIATPTWSAPHLLVSGFFDGARLLKVEADASSAELLWASRRKSEVNSDNLNALMSQPLIDGDYIYGVCAFGQLRCLRRSTGEQVWETQAATVERARNASAWLIRHQDRVFIYNDRGELIIARLRPEGYEEISRTKLLKPLSAAGARRELQGVNWSHPAFANRHILVRNDEEIVRFSLAADEYR